MKTFKPIVFTKEEVAVFESVFSQAYFERDNPLATCDMKKQYDTLRSLVQKLSDVMIEARNQGIFLGFDKLPEVQIISKKEVEK